MKASFEPEIEALSRALREMSEAGLVGDVPITLVTGPEEYLFGEEKALLEVIEGEDPLPRLFPPYIYGLFTTMPQMGWSAGIDLSSDGVAVPSSNPTLVNNVETLANVVPILGPGRRLVPEHGHRPSRPASRSRPSSATCSTRAWPRSSSARRWARSSKRVGGGPRPGRTIKAVLSGVANGVITARDLDAPVSYEGLAKIGSGLGSLGFIVYDDTADMVAVARTVSRFLYVESCGQCPACKFGTGEVTAYLDNIAAGEGTDHDVEVIGARLATVTDANRCYLGAQEQASSAASCASSPRSSPPTSRARRRRRRSRSRSSSTSSTASPSTTSARRASGPTGPTPSRERSVRARGSPRRRSR